MAVLIKPILTEKATSSNESGKFSFIVNKKANKIQVKKAVEKTYKVNVVTRDFSGLLVVIASKEGGILNLNPGVIGLIFFVILLKIKPVSKNQ